MLHADFGWDFKTSSDFHPIQLGLNPLITFPWLYDHFHRVLQNSVFEFNWNKKFKNTLKVTIQQTLVDKRPTAGFFSPQFLYSHGIFLFRQLFIPMKNVSPFAI